LDVHEQLTRIKAWLLGNVLIGRSWKKEVNEGVCGPSKIYYLFTNDKKIKNKEGVNQQ
jgi:hypothetical protein